MIINITKEDANVLVFLMNSMGDNVNSILKKNLGKIEGYKMYKRYTKLFLKLEKQLLLIQNEKDEKEITVYLKDVEFEMLKEFLNTSRELVKEKSDWYESLNNIVYAMLIADSDRLAVIGQ